MGNEYTLEDYLNCELLDVHRWSEYPEVIAARKQIVDELGLEGTKKELNHVMVVLLNLYHSYCLDPEMWVMYSRSGGDYNQGTRYNKLFIKYDNMIKTVDGLHALGYIEHSKGFQDRKTGYAFYSRMKATSKFAELVEKDNNVTYNMISKYVPDELIVLRDAAGVDIDYVDTKDIKRMRSLLEDYNKLLSQTYIDIHFDISDIQDRVTKRKSKGKEYRLYINLANKTVKRIFNKSTFSLGGRFYGGWWQNIPSQLRKKIIIDRDYTVEIDYSGLHISLLYALKGINFAELNKEPYIYPKDNDPSGLRPVFKKMLLAAVNSKDSEACVKAVRYEINMNRGEFPEEIPDLGELYVLFKKWHSGIDDLFCSKKGLELQNIDSHIAGDIVRIMTEQSIPVLVVHDSFIVAKKEEAFLEELMKKVYEIHVSQFIDQLEVFQPFNFIPIDVKTKDITLGKPELFRDNDILMDYPAWLDKPQGRRFTKFLLSEDPTTNVVMKVVNEEIKESGPGIGQPGLSKEELFDSE